MQCTGRGFFLMFLKPLCYAVKEKMFYYLGLLQNRSGQDVMKFCMGGIRDFIHPSRIVQDVEVSLQQFQQAQGMDERGSSLELPVVWKPPSFGSLLHLGDIK